MPIDLPSKAEGNDAVCEFLQNLLDEARKGEINFCGAVFARSPIDVRIGNAGVVGMEFAVYYGLDELKAHVRNGIEERKPPPRNESTRAHRVMYNLVQASCSFDFLPWLVQAEMTRRRENAPAPLRVGFYCGKSGDLDYALNTPQRTQLYHGVMLPLVEMISGVVDPTAIDGRQDGTLSFGPVFDAVRQGERLPELQLPPLVETEINDAVLEACGKRPVTITLREAEHHQHRNSNLPEWLAFARWLQKDQGEAVLFVRDTAMAREPLPGFDCCPPASENLFARVALYKQAKANMFVSNGPAMLALLLDRPYLMFQRVAEDSKYWPEQAEGFKHFTGIDAGGQWPIAGAQQRIIWAPDTFEHLRAAWLEHMQMKAAA